MQIRNRPKCEEKQINVFFSILRLLDEDLTVMNNSIKSSLKCKLSDKLMFNSVYYVINSKLRDKIDRCFFVVSSNQMR